MDEFELYADSSGVADFNRDLVAAVQWAGDWAMDFIVAKCNVMQFGPGTASDIVMHLLLVAQTMRDLWISSTSNLKSGEQTNSVVARAIGVFFYNGTGIKYTESCHFPSS